MQIGDMGGGMRLEAEMELDGKKSQLKKRLAMADKILVGIGGEWKSGGSGRQDEVKRAVAALKDMIEEKDYFIITTLSGEDLSLLDFEKGHMAAPLDVSFTEEQWDVYLKWLSFTLNRATVILELGEDFAQPAVMRWPFEKTASLNNRAFLYRVHGKFSQIPDELKGKAFALPENSVEFAGSFWEHEEASGGSTGPHRKY